MIKAKDLILLAAAVSLVACERPLINAFDEDQSEDDGCQITFNVAQFDVIPFDGTVRADVSEVATRLDIAVYDSVGTRIRKDDQTSTDSDFGTFKISLPRGNYSVAMIAHSGAGAATTTDAKKITFKDNKVTDTFLYYSNISVSADQTYDVTLKRVVAMVRFIIEDATPSNVESMKFYYTGGSSTLDATTGLGCVNSKQTELRDVDAAGKNGGATYEIYTFPHDGGSGEALKLTVSALDASSTVIQESEYTSVPIIVNNITQYNGTFFGGSTVSSPSQQFTLKANSTWEGNNMYSY